MDIVSTVCRVDTKISSTGYVKIVAHQFGRNSFSRERYLACEWDPVQQKVIGRAFEIELSGLQQ